MLTRRVAFASAALLPFAGRGARAQDQSFARFVDGVMAEARRAGIHDATLRAAFAGVAPNSRVIELDRNQPEFKLTWPEYRAKVLPESRIQLARQNFARQRDLLRDVRRRFAVDPAVIMGIWGIESNFGSTKGNYRLVEALSTLAWEGRRASYFRKELLNALRILDSGDVGPARLTGGWAGAMGQPQFMPSSYLTYAVDFDGDGRRDIWDSLPDVFGSIANYMARSGWRDGAPSAQPVQVPASIDSAIANRDDRRPLGAWMEMGVRRDDGSPFSRSDVQGALIIPTGVAPGQGFMVYPNFNAIRRYNPSDFYALAVSLLGDAAVI
ncbi:MAG: lytic murein transglycosylase [Acetobacteraceae bacterium]|nr:lytic murein transglycosylase [Acetobacteraceae bacterium]